MPKMKAANSSYMLVAPYIVAYPKRPQSKLTILGVQKNEQRGLNRRKSTN